MSETKIFTPPHPLKTPVLFLVFNRLNTTKHVFEAIRRARPPRLYIGADGAREGKEGEGQIVQEIRNFIVNSIDWECKIETLFRDQNLGCKLAVSSAISWFFENEEEGIILEDDCLPSQSFFWYCEELLNKYRYDESVFTISGDSRGPDSIKMKEDYSFCKYPIIWGWASWARAWKNYDPLILDWPSQKSTLPIQISRYRLTVKFWKIIFDSIYNNEIDTWDYQLCYLLLKNNGKCIVPRENLITNIGFGAGATHTIEASSKWANRRRFEINIPLEHKLNSQSEIQINKFFDKNEFNTQSFLVRIINKVSRLSIGKNILD